MISNNIDDLKMNFYLQYGSTDPIFCMIKLCIELEANIMDIENTRKMLLAHYSSFDHHGEKGGMLCSFLKKFAGSTSVFTRTNLSKLFLKYFLPQMLACP